MNEQALPDASPARPTVRSAWLAGWLAAGTLVSVAPLLVWQVSPGLFPAGAHDGLAATPLVLVALAFIVHQVARGAPPLELVKASVLALGFLLWAANQFWPDAPHATLYNDLAIAAFVLDAVLMIVGWPPATRP